ncbi:homoserine kinase [Veillonella criceti]|uniref:Homoserine kinase n=1 Tax=Veillonella criceti TaxID=103891 RepID=A0A380NJE1_9FIRM|nr:homoserine kinase [Veillonella criceti]SUP40931.1 Homoserine kinase [Veillonella criceti]
MNPIVVKVPATSANCGPGFDSLGLALELYNTFTFMPDETATCNTYTFDGFDAELLAKEDQANNLVGYAMQQVFAKVAVSPIYGTIHSEAAIPPSRGLGSSSTAIVAGLLLANATLATPLSKHELLLLANEIEGHPDNVAPALLGNLVCAVNHEQGLLYTTVTLPDELVFAVVVPDVIVSTEYARSVLPKAIAHKEAVANVSHATLFVTALLQHKLDYLRIALEDYLHVPYRKSLIPYCDDVFKVALEQGAYGATISGSGSTLIAYCSRQSVNQVKEAMAEIFVQNNIACHAYIVEADTVGASYINCQK